MLKKYHGIIPPIITPVDARENVDESGYRQLLEYCVQGGLCLLYTSPSPRDGLLSRMPSSA